MVKITCLNCEKKHKNKLFIFYPNKNNFKIEIEDTKLLNFDIYTKNNYKISGDFEIKEIFVNDKKIFNISTKNKIIISSKDNNNNLKKITIYNLKENKLTINKIYNNEICNISHNNDNNSNWELCIDYYKDLKLADINTEYEAYKHWINWGKNGGRFCSLKDFKTKFSLIDSNNININIIIVTSYLIESIAFNFKKMLEELNFNVEIIYILTKELCEKSSYNDIYIIIYHDSDHDLLPKIFILYQIEQSESNFFIKKKMNMLKKANIIWDFSIKNKKKFPEIALNKYFIQPMPFYYENQILNNNLYDNDIIYDIFFYGTENNRRKNILDLLKQRYNIYVSYMTYGKERDYLIYKSKIILNLHYYNDCALESCRINEILNFNKLIISELPSVEDWYNVELYKNSVIFIDLIEDNLSNMNNLYQKIDYYLNKLNYDDKIEEIKKNNEIIHKKSLFFLKKNILQIKNENYKFNYDLDNNKIYCLHLLETPNRINLFKNQEFYPNVEIFPAIKFNPGWIGCAYSYCNLITNAKRCHLSSITICEDDCKFKPDFYNKYEIIKSFLEKINNEWDIFVGCIASIPEETNFIKIYEYMGITFIEIDKIHSMVFNIYNKSCYNIFEEWNDLNKDSTVNQIDQYLKRKKLKIIITYPFEFSCIDVKSTLWGKNMYNEYELAFKKSLDLIKVRINNKKVIKLI